MSDKKPSKIVPRSMLLERRAAAAIVQLPVEKAAAILATCVKVDEVREIRDRAEVIAMYKRRKAGGEDAARDAEAIVEHADRRLGELLAGERVERGRPKRNATPVTHLPKAEKRTSQRSAARSKAKAAIPAKRFETTIGEALETKRSPKKAVAALIAKPKAKPPIEAKPVEASAPAAQAAGYMVPLERDAWDERAAVRDVCNEMSGLLASWDETMPIETVRVSLHRWLGMVRG